MTSVDTITQCREDWSSASVVTREKNNSNNSTDETQQLILLLKLIHTATPDTKKLCCLCRDRLRCELDSRRNSRLSPAENFKSDHVQIYRLIRAGTADTTQTGPSCLVWRRYELGIIERSPVRLWWRVSRWCQNAARASFSTEQQPRQKISASWKTL